MMGRSRPAADAARNGRLKSAWTVAGRHLQPNAEGPVDYDCPGLRPPWDWPDPPEAGQERTPSSLRLRPSSSLLRIINASRAGFDLSVCRPKLPSRQEAGTRRSPHRLAGPSHAHSVGELSLDRASPEWLPPLCHRGPRDASTFTTDRARGRGAEPRTRPFGRHHTGTVPGRGPVRHRTRLVL